MHTHKIEIKSHFTDWHQATEAQALRFAAVLYNHMTCPNKIAKVHEHIRGITFTDEQIRNELTRAVTSTREQIENELSDIRRQSGQPEEAAGAGKAKDDNTSRG